VFARIGRLQMNRWIPRLIALTMLPASGLWAQGLAGTWQGTVRNPDTKDDLRTVLKIASSQGNPINANFWSIDQTYLVFPATLNVQGSVLKLSIPGIGANWEGKLSADGATLTGTLKGFSVPTTWTMKRVNESEAWAIPKPPAPVRPMAADADPAFEVATIKPSPPDANGRGIRVQGMNVSTLNWTLTDMVTFAYDLHAHQFIGAPAWTTSEKYDITGKPDAEGQPSSDQVKFLLRKLLASRFQLTFHKEQRVLPVYTLSVAKGGAKISKNDPKNETTGIVFRAPGSVLLNNVTMGDFCRMLQNAALDRPVVDQTGLTGKYDFSLVWTPDQLQAPIPNTNALAPTDNAPPGLYAATQEQLGLKIEAARLPIDVLVVDKLEKPSDN
jgi:uncharacterized protein (TIGR03435 family)